MEGNLLPKYTNHGKAHQSTGMPFQAACEEPPTPHSNGAQWNPLFNRKLHADSTTRHDQLTTKSSKITCS